MASTEPTTSTTVSPFVWPTRPLGELEASKILSLRNGFSCGTHNVEGEGIPHLRPFNVTEHGRLSFDVIKAIPSRPGMETYALLAGDVLYNNTNSEELVGKCAYWPGREGLHVLSNHMTILRTLDPNHLQPRFLALYLLWLWTTGAARRLCRRHVNQASIGLERMRQIAVPLPPAREQHAIADSLTKIQSAADLQDRIVAVLKAIKAATMAKLFREGLRGEPLKQTAVGEIPRSWQILRLGDVAEIERGKFAHRPRNAPEFYGGTIPFIQTGDVTQGNGRIRRYTQTLNERGLEISRVFPKGTVVLTIAANIGDTGILEFDSAFPDSLVGITPNESLDPVFLEYYLRTQKEEMSRLAPKGTQKNINLQFLRPWPVPCPPIDEQRRIAASLRCLDDRLDAATSQRNTIRSLFSSMLHLLMTGRVRVTPRMIAMQALADRVARRPKWSGTVDEKLLQEVVRRVVEAVAPEKIILFGSAARGEMGPDSDLDLLVVKACDSPREVERVIYRRLIGIGIPKDVLVVTPDHLEKHKDTIGYIYRPAVREGKVIYAG